MAHTSYIDSDGVPFNKYDIVDNSTLSGLEYEIAAMRQAEILNGEKKLKNEDFGLERLKEIHSHLFGDLYEWAGKVRTVPSSKRGENGLVGVFASPDDINERWNSLELKARSFVENKKDDYSTKVNALVDVFVEANNIHPFPEGNGRALQTYMQQLAETQEIKLDFSKVSAKQWNEACQISGVHGHLFERSTLVEHRKNKEPIRAIFNEMAQKKMVKNLTAKEIMSLPIAERPTAVYKPTTISKGLKK